MRGETSPNPIPEELRERLSELFAERVDRQEECWEWVGHIGGGGYGVISMRHDGDQHFFLAHRVSWLLHHGEDPGESLVCHTCDVRSCVNPEHLFLGTPADNSGDAVEKGRIRHGEGHPSAELNRSDVLEARLLYRDGGVSKQQLAERFGVSRQTMGEALSGETWAHLPGAVPRGSVDAGQKLEDVEVEEILHLVEEGSLTHAEIAEKYGVSRSYVSMLVTGKRRGGRR